MQSDAVEEVEEVEMNWIRHLGPGNQARVKADNVQEELVKELWMHKLYYDLMMRVLRIVGDSLTVSLDWKMFACGMIVPWESRTFVDSLIVLRDLNDFGDSLDVWRDSWTVIAKNSTAGTGQATVRLSRCYCWPQMQQDLAIQRARKPEMVCERSCSSVEKIW